MTKTFRIQYFVNSDIISVEGLKNLFSLFARDPSYGLGSPECKALHFLINKSLLKAIDFGDVKRFNDLKQLSKSLKPTQWEYDRYKDDYFMGYLSFVS